MGYWVNIELVKYLWKVFSEIKVLVTNEIFKNYSIRQPLVKKEVARLHWLAVTVGSEYGATHEKEKKIKNKNK